MYYLYLEGGCGQGRLVVAGQAAAQTGQHLLQVGLRGRVKGHGSSGALHVVDGMGLQQGVDRQSVDVQLHTNAL